MSNPGEDFYDLTSPPYPQQGDIFPNVPLISPPPGPHLVILRETDGKPWTPKPGLLQASAEQLVNAFDDVPEYIAVSAERGLAAILTQTCDLDQGQWLVCPLITIEGTNIDEGNLLAGKYASLLGMPRHPRGYFETGCLFLPQCFSIRRESVQQKDRVASLTLSAQHALSDKLSETLTRVWGFSPGEIVLQTGKYRCVRCFQFYDVKNEVVEFQAGQKFGDCPDCLKIKKRAQWRPLRKHQKY
ncbi:MAG TPA: hypothetical protein VGR03_10435 [Candidatus Acidoferrum sp.]|nr:hypothetical protein [Candidatus Acidoferrum sp.]